MREILFKAKRVDNGEWVIAPAFMTLKNETESCTKMLNFRNGNSTIKHNEEMLFLLDGVIVDPETICQFTGIKDKNGNKIFENDIVKLNIELQGYSSGEPDDDLSFFGYIIGYVRFIPCKGFCLQSALIYDEIIEEKRKHNTKKNIVSYRSEVIGNKFDNPELLEVGEC